MADRRTFPIEGSGRTFPLRWSERTFPLPYARRTRFRKNYIPLLAIDFDSGMRRYSFQGVRFDGAFYDDKLLSISSIRREVLPLAGEYAISQGEAWLSNVNQEFSELREGEAWRNRDVFLFFGDVHDGVAGFQTICTMKLIDWRFEEGRTKIVFKDPGYDRFRSKVTNTLYTVNDEVFPDRPERQGPNLVPLVYGEHKSANTFGSGVLPAYPIDPAQSQVKYRYVAAHGALKEITNVYVYDVLVSSGYTVTYVTYDGQQFTCIDFDVDPFDPARSGEKEVSYDCLGLTDDGTFAGVMLELPSEVFAYFMVDWAATAEVELDFDLLNTELEAEDDNDYKCALAITDENDTYFDIISRWCESFMKVFFTTRLGLFGVYGFIGADVDPDPVAEVTASTEILEGSLGIDNNKQVASHLLFRFNRQYFKDYWIGQRLANFVGEDDNLGEVILKECHLYYVRDQDTADAIAESRLYLLTESAHYPGIALPIQFYTMDLNQFLLLTHWMGIGADGYEEASARITSLTIGPMPQSMKVTAGMIRREF